MNDTAISARTDSVTSGLRRRPSPERPEYSVTAITTSTPAETARIAEVEPVEKMASITTAVPASHQAVDNRCVVGRPGTNTGITNRKNPAMRKFMSSPGWNVSPACRP